MFLVLRGHGHRFVGQLILFGLLRLDTEGNRARPVLSFNHWRQLPVLVGTVGDGNHLDITASHLRAEVLNFFDGWDACTTSCQCQGHWLVRTSVQEATQFLGKTSVLCE